MTEKTASDDALAGSGVYSQRTLRAYDWFVLGLSNRFIWKCPTPQLLEHYNQHVSSIHLDIGVGTGYFLDRCRFPSAQPKITLMDLNEASLRYTANRIARFEPATVRCNVLESFPPEIGKFDSIAMNYLLHCLPGSLESKSEVFDHCLAHLNSQGVVFGSTLLGGGVKRSWPARHLMQLYNRKQIFSNREDSLEALRTALEARFTSVCIEVVGCVAIFHAQGVKADV